MTTGIAASSLPAPFRHTVLFACLGVFALAQSTNPPPVYRWTTLAGRASIGLEDGPVADARFNHPHGLATDSAGNLYVADTGNHTVRKISTDGIVSTLAGAPGQPGSTDGPGPNARFNGPQGVAVDTSGNVYVADTGNYTIRRITPAGVVTTLAGQSGIKGTADGPAASALFEVVSQLAVDATGNVYLADHGIRKISGGSVTTLFTQGQVTDRDGQVYTVGAGSSVTVDPLGQLYFSGIASPSPIPWWSPYVLCLVKMDAAGVLSFAVDPLQWADAGYYERSIGPMAADGVGGVYFFGTVEVYYGTLYPSYYVGPAGISGGSGSITSSAGWPDQPLGLARDSSGNAYYTRTSDSVIIKNGSLYAGTAWLNGGLDGLGSAARLGDVGALALDPAGNVWVADQLQQHFYDNHGGDGAALRKITPAGEVSTSIYQSPNLVYSMSPRGVATDGTGNVFFAFYSPTYPMNIFQVSPDGSKTVFPTYLQWVYGTDLVANPAGTLLLLDYNVVRKWTPGSGWVVLAGNNSPAQILDGTGDAAQFSNLVAATADRSGDFFVLDYQAGTNGTGAVCYIRKLTAAGTVTTISRNLVMQTGPTGTTTELAPHALAVDSHGTFFLLYPDYTVRQLTATGDPVVIGGTAWIAGSLDSNSNRALFYQASSLAVDAQDNLYVADATGTTIRQGRYLGVVPTITTQPHGLSIASGGSAQFSVVATGIPAPTCQWYFNGSLINGATASTFSFSNARAADAGDYTVVVTNSLGSVTSDKAALTVMASPIATPAAESGGGGGGSIEGWFVLALFALGLTRRWRT